MNTINRIINISNIFKYERVKYVTNNSFSFDLLSIKILVLNENTYNLITINVEKTI